MIYPVGTELESQKTEGPFGYFKETWTVTKVEGDVMTLTTTNSRRLMINWVGQKYEDTVTRQVRIDDNNEVVEITKAELSKEQA